jgi:hypothetical protein
MISITNRELPGPYFFVVTPFCPSRFFLRSPSFDVSYFDTRGCRKKEVGHPRGGWVGQRPKKQQDLKKSGMFFVMFSNFPCRETPKNAKKKSAWALWENFGGVFELPSQKNAQKRDKTKQNEEKYILDFFGKGFRQQVVSKTFLYGVF